MCHESHVYVICHYGSHRMWHTAAVSYEEAVSHVWWRVRTAENKFLDRDLMDGWLLSDELRAKKGA